MNAKLKEKIAEAQRQRWKKYRENKSAAENALIGGENIVKSIINQVLALDLPAENKLEMIMQLFRK